MIYMFIFYIIKHIYYEMTLFYFTWNIFSLNISHDRNVECFTGNYQQNLTFYCRHFSDGKDRYRYSFSTHHFVTLSSKWTGELQGQNVFTKRLRDKKKLLFRSFCSWFCRLSAWNSFSSSDNWPSSSSQKIANEVCFLLAAAAEKTTLVSAGGGSGDVSVRNQRRTRRYEPESEDYRCLIRPHVFGKSVFISRSEYFLLPPQSNVETFL